MASLHFFSYRYLLLTALIVALTLTLTTNVSSQDIRQVEYDNRLNYRPPPSVEQRQRAIEIEDELRRGRESPIHLWSWRWDEVKKYLVVTIFLLVAALVKVVYHHAHYLHGYVPESCVLILLGTVFELILYWADAQEHVPAFRSDIFFFLLLPPIILEAAYSLHDRTFFNNLGTVLLYAIIGTLINVFVICGILYLVGRVGIYGTGFELPFIEALTFATLISAVDPVAVLAIFQEVGVNKSLYFLVFGESLLNDAVVITMYNSVTIFAASTTVQPMDMVLGVVNFMTVSLGGLTIGIGVGIMTAIITKFTSDVRVVEPLIVIAMAYMSYVTAELFHFSGIIALISCGLVQFEYAKDNLSRNSFTTINYFTKNLSSISDVIIFFFLGKVLIRSNHDWNTAFVLIAVLSCVVVRFGSVFSLTWFANNVFKRTRQINFEEQLVMSYGGLRGAIAFSLAIMLKSDDYRNNDLFVTTTLAVILFTVFILGSTTRPLVRLLRVKKDTTSDPKMFLFINEKIFDTFMAGFEGVAGQRRHNYWCERFARINEKYIKPLLTTGYSTSDPYKEVYNQVKYERPFSTYQKSRGQENGRSGSKSKPEPMEYVPESNDDLVKVILREKNQHLLRGESIPEEGQIELRDVRGQSDSTEITIPPEGLSGPGQDRVRFLSADMTRSEAATMPLTGRRRMFRRFHSQISPDNVRRTLNSALFRTSYYQMPGSHHSVEHPSPLRPRTFSR